MKDTYYTEHPFAQYVRILGKGKNGSRPLTREEAYTAMKMIMANEVEPVQLGAFMMLMRVKEETREELAGFIQAVRDSIQLPTDTITVDLDWSSYAGKRRHLPWFLLSALLLAENGIKVFMHGTSGHTNGRIYTEDMLPYLNLKEATSLTEAIDHIKQSNFAYLPLKYFSPKLQEIIEFRPLMGLRSPVHTVGRMLNPLNAPHILQGIYHPNYRPVHQEAAMLLGFPHLAVFKGEGGEIERDPDSECLVQSVHNEQLEDETWPPMFAQRHVKEENLQPEKLAKVWCGEDNDEFAQGAVTGTAAIALRLMGKATSVEAAYQQASDMWQNRNKERLNG